MFKTRLAKLLAITLVLAFMAGLVAISAAPAEAVEGFQVLSPEGVHWDRTYGEWAEEWMKWWVGEPVDSNPMLDETGENCREGQDGKVWFLTGVIGEGAVTRECTVKKHKALFFPVYNFMWLPWPSDDPLDDETKIAIEEWFASVIAGMSGAVTIDGVAVADLADYQVNTDWHSARLPDDDVIDYLEPGENWPKGKVEPFFADGVYLLLEPLDEGVHTIHIEHSDGLDVTYILTVE